MNKLKYLGHSIVFQEVPDEVSLAFNISGCPYKCKGCHSEYLWEYEGDYISDDIEKLLEEYFSYITCVCFMGGNQNPDELFKLLEMVKKYNLKTCVYIGAKDIPNEKWIELCDYLKIGAYKKEFGGLNSKTTNQKFYKAYNNPDCKIFEDITYLFQKESKYEENKNY